MRWLRGCNQWRGYTGRKSRRYAALVSLKTAGQHSIQLAVSRFQIKGGEALENYDFATSLILPPGQKERPDKCKTEWQGKVPKFNSIRWVGGTFEQRPRAYLKQGGGRNRRQCGFRHCRR